jgi:hypothetical protein
VRLEAAGLGALHLLADAGHPARIHRVVGEGALFEEFTEVGGVDRVLDDGVEPGADFGAVAVADGLDQEFAQGPAFKLQLAEDIEHLAAEGVAGLVEFFEEPPVDVAFAGFGGDEVPQVADLGLADAVDAPEALLDAVRVPRQVVVDHEVSALEVDAFAGGVGGQQDADCGVVEEALLGVAPLVTAHAAVDDGDRVGASEERHDALLEVPDGVTVFGKDDELLVRRGDGRREGPPVVGGGLLACRAAQGTVREDLLEEFGELAPLGVSPAPADPCRQVFEALERLDLAPQLLDGLGRGRLVEDPLLDLRDLVVGGVFEV